MPLESAIVGQFTNDDDEEVDDILRAVVLKLVVGEWWEKAAETRRVVAVWVEAMRAANLMSLIWQ